MIIEEKKANQRKGVLSRYKHIDESKIANSEIKKEKKIYDRDSKDSNFTLNQEPNRITEKQHQITIAVFVVSLIYSLGFLLKYSPNTRFQSIILSLIISCIFTRFISLLLGRYFTSQTKRQKKFDK
jgi:hypothetical protein